MIAHAPSPSERRIWTRNPVPSTPSEHGVHRRVVRALATRPLTGVVLVDYGIRHAVAALGGIAGWALTLAAGALLSFCAIVTAYPGGGAS